MVNFAPELKQTGYSNPYREDTSISIHQEGISNADLLDQVFTGSAELSRQLYRYAEEAEKDLLKAAEKRNNEAVKADYNEYYRQLQKIQAKAQQTGNWTAADIETRKLMDDFSRRPGVEYAKLLEGVGKSDFTGSYTLEKDTRKFWNDKNNEADYKAVEAFRTANPSLSAALTPEETSSYIKAVNDEWDTATKYISRLNSIDSGKEPAEYNRVKNQLTESLGNNVVSTSMLEILDAKGSLKSSADLEVFRTRLIEKYVKAGVDRATAAVVVEQGIQRSGIVDLINSANKYQTTTVEDIERTIKYNVATGKEQMGATKNIFSALMVSSDNWQKGDYYSDVLDREVGKIWNDMLEELATTGRVTKSLSTTDANRGGVYKGAVDILKSRLNAPSKGAAIDQVFDDAIAVYDSKSAEEKVQGLSEILSKFDNAYLDVNIQELLSSNNPAHRETGKALQRKRQRLIDAKDMAMYEISNTPGADALGQLKQGPGASLLRVNKDGQLAVIDGSKGFLQSAAITLTDATGRYFGNVASFNKEFSDMFEDAEVRKQLLEAGNIPVLNPSTDTVIGRREWYLGEKVSTNAGGYQGIGQAFLSIQNREEEPADNAERQNKIRAELKAANELSEIRARVERLKEQKKNMSPAALKEYGKGLDADIKAAEDLLKDGDEHVVSSNISHSDTMTNAFYDMSPEDQNAMVAAREVEFMEAVDKLDADMDNTQKITSGYYEKLAKDAEAAEKELEDVEAEIIKAEERYELTGRQHYLDMLKGLEEERRELNAIINKKYREFEE